jgi:hypothetical protein
MTKQKSAPTRKDTSAKAKALRQPRKSKKADTQGSYKGIAYESLEELAFLQWAFELVKTGFILHIGRSESFLLCDALAHNYAQQLKTKSKPMQQLLLHGHSYTPEFDIQWNDTAIRAGLVWVANEKSRFDALFIGRYLEGRLVTTIEVKPMFDQNNMERLFKVNQKWMWDKHHIFVNLVKPQMLFKETFTPREYLTSPAGRPRKLKWVVRSVGEFLNKSK